MTEAENYQILIEGARTDWEQGRALNMASCASTALLNSKDGQCQGLYFSDGSYLDLE